MCVKNKISYLIATGLMLIAASAARAEQNASFGIFSASQSYTVGQTFSVKVTVPAVENGFDFARLELSYPADTLQVQSFSFGQSFSFAAPENTFDNVAGTLSYGAGIPGGTKEKSDFGTISFKVKKAGEANLSVGQGSMILSEGNNIFSGTGISLKYNFIEPQQKQDKTPKPTQQAQPVQIVQTETDKPDNADKKVSVKILTDENLPADTADFWTSNYGKILSYSGGGILALFVASLLVMRRNKKINPWN